MTDDSNLPARECRYRWQSLQMLAGSALGYSRAQHALSAALEEAGGINDPDARMVVHFTTPMVFRPSPGRLNVLYTMNESAWPAPWFTRGLRKADVVIVPTEWNAAVIRRVWGGPVYVAPLGVYPEFFAGVKRERPKGKPFRFLWLGAHNDRKGWRDVLEAWKAAFQFSPKVELYIKTTPNPGNTEPIAVRRHGNIAIDNRVVPEEELYKLYVEADCFVFPSWGEGWGLPLLEAMATALPCIAGCWTGMTAFADPTVVRPLRSQARLVAVRDVPNSDWLEYEPMMTPDHASVVETMRWVLTHWAKAQAMGRRACERAQGFTWSAAGQRLRDVLLEIDARAG